MWKAIITNVSDVDALGTIEVIYDIYFDDDLKFQNKSVRVKAKSEADTLIKMALQDLKSLYDEKSLIQVGTEITI